MVTPFQARNIATILNNAPYSSGCTNDAADALHDLASQVESLQAELAEKTNAETGDMTLEQAMNLGKLWAAGKIIGGDAYAAAAVLAGHMDDLQADAERMNWIELQGDDFITGVLHDCPAAGTYYVSGSWCTGEGKTFREAIDEARKQS